MSSNSCGIGEKSELWNVLTWMSLVLLSCVGLRPVQDLFTCDPTKIKPTSPVYFSLWHEACDRVVSHERLKELFGLPRVQEIALFRDPVDRAVSAYYFWGEIGKEKARRGPSRFPYHGNMSTAPPQTLAMAYAENPMFMRGPPGPTYSSTFWASTTKDSTSIMRARVFVLILERFDESLVLLRNHVRCAPVNCLFGEPARGLTARFLVKHSWAGSWRISSM